MEPCKLTLPRETADARYIHAVARLAGSGLDSAAASLDPMSVVGARPDKHLLDDGCCNEVFQVRGLGAHSPDEAFVVPHKSRALPAAVEQAVACERLV